MSKSNTYDRSAMELAFQKLEKEELIALLFQSMDRIEELSEEQERQARRIKELEGQVEELLRASHRQAAPFGREQTEKKAETERKRPGRKAGHEGYYRKCSGPIDEQVEQQLEGCPSCSGIAFTSIKRHEQIIEELPEARVHRTRVVTYSGRCCGCGQTVRSQHPFQVSQATGSAGVHLGARVLSRAVELQYEFGLSKRKVCDLFDRCYGLKLTAGGLVHLSHRLAKRLKGYYDQLLASVRQARVLHVDETSWYVGDRGYWLWVFANEYLSVYQVADNRSKAVAEHLLGKDFAGVLVSDCYSVYDDLCEHQQKCYAHHLKAIHIAIEQDPNKGRGFLKLVQRLLRRALSYHHIRDQLDDTALAKLRQNLELKAEELIPVIERPLTSDPSRTVLEFDPNRCPFDLEGSALGIAKRLAKQRDHLFTFLYFHQVDPTNNLAERRLRPAVISRKLSCGNRTRKGADTWQILTSIINSFKLTGDSLLQTIASQIALR